MKLGDLIWAVLLALLLAWVGYIHVDAIRCWQKGGSPVASFGRYVCIQQKGIP